MSSGFHPAPISPLLAFLGNLPSDSTWAECLFCRAMASTQCLNMVSAPYKEQREPTKWSPNLQRKLEDGRTSEKRWKELGFFPLERAGYVMGLQFVKDSQRWWPPAVPHLHSGQQRRKLASTAA